MSASANRRGVADAIRPGSKGFIKGLSYIPSTLRGSWSIRAGALCASRSSREMPNQLTKRLRKGLFLT